MDRNTLHTNHCQRAFQEDYKNYSEEEEEEYYAEPAYEVYLAEQSSTRIAEAHKKASCLPAKAPPWQKFEGVFPPPCKK